MGLSRVSVNERAGGRGALACGDVFAWFAGWDGVALPGNYGNVNWYWWLPIVAPIVGGVIGAFVYDYFINKTLVGRGEPEATDIEVKGEAVEELP